MCFLISPRLGMGIGRKLTSESQARTSGFASGNSSDKNKGKAKTQKSNEIKIYQLGAEVLV